MLGEQKCDRVRAVGDQWVPAERFVVAFGVIDLFFGDRDVVSFPGGCTSCCYALSPLASCLLSSQCICFYFSV
jgi:hypothetical protein